jgi:hypothetical protein
MGMQNCGMGLASNLDDSKRDACLHSLGDHYAAGRLSAEELDGLIQAALAAETEADLAAVMSDLSVDPSVEHGPERVRRGGPRLHAPTAPRFRWVLAVVVLAVGGALVAAAGPRSNAAEFSAGLAIGLLGFLTHWWLTGRSGQQARAGDDAPVEVPVPEPETGDVTRYGATRPVGRGTGLIPRQRTGD